MLIVLVFGVLGFGCFCWLLATLAVYALPFYAGMTAGLASLQAGAGIIGSLGIGVLAGVATIVVGQWAFAASRTAFARTVIGMVFAAPATIAGYSISSALAGFETSGAAQQALAVLGGLITGVIAYSRLVSFVYPADSQVPANSLAD